MRHPFTNYFLDITIEEGISYAKFLSENKDYNETLGLFSKLEELIDCIEELRNGKSIDYFDSKVSHSLGLSTLIKKIDLLRVAICFFYSKISTQPASYGFEIINISGITKNDNYLHKIRNHFGIEFMVSLKSIAKKENQDKIDIHQLDFNQFTIHPCSDDGLNWLFVNTERDNFKCKFCDRIVVHQKILSEFDANDDFSISILSSEDFDVFFKNNIKNLEKKLTMKDKIWSERHFNARGGSILL